MQKELKVLDGGMGGELIARGIMPSNGLWSVSYTHLTLPTTPYV